MQDCWRARLPAQIEFGKDVQPVFPASCVGCHGPALQIGGFRIDRRYAMPNRLGAIATLGPSAGCWKTGESRSLKRCRGHGADVEVDDAHKVHLLLEHGANVNARSGQGRIALIMAAGRFGQLPSTLHRLRLQRIPRSVRIGLGTGFSNRTLHLSRKCARGIAFRSLPGSPHRCDGRVFQARLNLIP